jgi:hypothetical protein
MACGRAVAQGFGFEWLTPQIACLEIDNRMLCDERDQNMARASHRGAR